MTILASLDPKANLERLDWADGPRHAALSASSISSARRFDGEKPSLLPVLG